MKAIHSTKADSPGYTRYFFDEPIGTASGGVRLTGEKMKHAGGPQVVVDDLGNLTKEDEREFSIILHGQQFVDLPNEIKELKFEDGKTLSLSGGSSE